MKSLNRRTAELERELRHKTIQLFAIVVPAMTLSFYAGFLVFTYQDSNHDFLLSVWNGETESVFVIDHNLTSADCNRLRAEWLPTLDSNSFVWCE